MKRCDSRVKGSRAVEGPRFLGANGANRSERGPCRAKWRVFCYRPPVHAPGDATLGRAACEASPNVVVIAGDAASGTRLSGFTITNAGLEGVFVNKTSHITIEHNTVVNTARSNDSRASGVPVSPSVATKDLLVVGIDRKADSSLRSE